MPFLRWPFVYWFLLLVVVLLFREFHGFWQHVKEQTFEVISRMNSWRSFPYVSFSLSGPGKKKNEIRKQDIAIKVCLISPNLYITMLSCY